MDTTKSCSQPAALSSMRVRMLSFKRAGGTGSYAIRGRGGAREKKRREAPALQKAGEPEAGKPL